MKGVAFFVLDKNGFKATWPWGFIDPEIPVAGIIPLSFMSGVVVVCVGSAIWPIIVVVAPIVIGMHGARFAARTGRHIKAMASVAHKHTQATDVENVTADCPQPTDGYDSIKSKGCGEK